MIMNKFIHRYGPTVAWPLVALCILILIVFAVLRAAQTYGFSPTPDRLFELRYLDHPIISAIHMASGIAFVLFAPLQFIKRLRNNNLGLHRGLGRVLVSCALIAGSYGLIATVALPAFGGVSTETAGWFFGTLFIFSLLRAYWCARNKKIALHREWMIRAFAMGLAVGTQRLLLLILVPTTGQSFEAVFGSCLWLGFSINLLIAEVWINLSRERR
jgi:uncharacterized membrane protein